MRVAIDNLYYVFIENGIFIAAIDIEIELNSVLIIKTKVNRFYTWFSNIADNI